MVVRELLDPPHVLHEQFLGRRRDEPLELPLFTNRVDEVKTAREHGEEAEERFPYHVLADRMMDRLQSVRALCRCEVLGEGKDQDRKSTRLNSSHSHSSYAVGCLQ